MSAERAESLLSGNVTYHQQVSYCGKPRCRKCREGVGHGPYWYAYRNENGRTTRTYIGKELPPELQKLQEAASGLNGLSNLAEHTVTEADPTVIRIRVLGQFQLERRHGRQWQGVTEAAWQHQRVRSLLAYLISSVGRKWGREQVMDALWPELDFENASGRLDRAVYSLRQLFEPSLERPGASRLLRSEREGLVLADQSHIWVDADAFESCIARANASSDPGEKEQLLEEAVALYGGDFLPEEQHADWAVARREMLQRAWLGLLLELADLRIARGALFNAIEPLDRLLMSDPANEAAVQRLMVSLAQLDRRGEALQAFSRFSSALKRLYGIAPLPETRQLYKAIQQGNIPVLLPHTGQGMPTDGRSAGGESVQQPRPINPVNRTPFGRTHANPLIGREGEVEALRQILLHTEESTHASASSRKKFSILPSEQRRRPHCAVLVGEAGIGKTRLAEEISREAQQRGWTIAWSRVYAQESSVPFRQWTEVLRNAMTYGLLPKQEISRQPLVFQPLSSLLPEMHTVLPQVTFPAPLSPEQEQLRLWEATLALLVTISERTPLLLVLDDFHWADVSSCELFAYLVRRLQDHPIAIIGTYRDNELPASHPLRSLLTALQREQVMAHMPVEPLTKEQIARLVNYLPQSVVQHIQNQAAGNPFFAEELARGLSSVPDSASATPLASATVADAPGDAQTSTAESPGIPGELPDTIAAVLELRMGRLSAPCQRLLGNAAVLGGSFEFTTITRMEAGGINATDEDTILDLIEEALQAGVITEEGTGTHISYHFWHPLLASHLYDKLSAARRASLHRRAANVLQHLYRNREDEGAATITHHLVEGGGDTELIVHYAELAGNHAYALSAYPEAERYYRVAATHLEALQTEQGMREGNDEQAQLAYLLERLGECTKLQGNFEDARQFYEKTLAIRSQQEKHASELDFKHEAQIQALLWCEIGWAWYGLGDNERAKQYCELGELTLHRAEINSGPTWAMLRFQRSYISTREGNYDQASTFAQEALKLYEEVLEHQNYYANKTSHLTLTGTELTLAGDPVNLGRIHMQLGILANYMGQSSTALMHFQKALSVFEQFDRQREIANVSCNLGDIHLRKAEHETAQAFFRRSLHLAERVGDIPLLAVTFDNLGEVAIRTGNLMEAETYLKKGFKLAEQINDEIYMDILCVYLGIASQDQDKLADAAAYITKALRIGRQMQNVPCIALALIALANLRIAQTMKANGVERGFHKGDSNNLLRRARKVIARVLTIEELDVETKLKGQIALIQVLFLSDELENALHLAMQTLEDAVRYELTWGRVCTQRLLGSILAAQGQQDKADEYFAQALQAFISYGMRLEYARTLHAYGLVLVKRQENDGQHRSQGMGYLQEAQHIFKDCHATFDVQLVESTLHTITHADT